MNQTVRALPSKIEMFSDFETTADTPARSGLGRRIEPRILKQLEGGMY